MKCSNCGGEMIFFGWKSSTSDFLKVELTFQCTDCRKLEVKTRRVTDPDVQELIKAERDNE